MKEVGCVEGGWGRWFEVEWGSRVFGFRGGDRLFELEWRRASTTGSGGVIAKFGFKNDAMSGSGVVSEVVFVEEREVERNEGNGWRRFFKRGRGWFGDKNDRARGMSETGVRLAKGDSDREAIRGSEGAGGGTELLDENFIARGAEFFGGVKVGAGSE